MGSDSHEPGAGRRNPAVTSQAAFWEKSFITFFTMVQDIEQPRFRG
jgi:hypothetical protein